MVFNWIRVLCVLVASCVGSALLGQEEWDSITVIGNTLGEEQISKKELVDIFRGQKKYWKNNESVLLVIPSEKHDGALVAAEALYKMSVAEMQKFWLATVFQGRTNPPVFERTNEDILQLVIETPGAIGILINFQGQIPESLLIKIL